MGIPTWSSQTPPWARLDVTIPIIPTHSLGKELEFLDIQGKAILEERRNPQEFFSTLQSQTGTSLWSQVGEKKQEFLGLDHLLRKILALPFPEFNSMFGEAASSKKNGIRVRGRIQEAPGVPGARKTKTKDLGFSSESGADPSGRALDVVSSHKTQSQNPIW